MNKFRSQFIVLSAPSGAGKTTIAKMLIRRHEDMAISISATTRPKRPKEQEGKDYYFLTEDIFIDNIKNNNFLEYEEVHGDHYGTLKSKVEELLGLGKAVAFDIDVKGALSIKKLYPQAILIFIKPPTLEELIKRLKQRKSERDEEIEKRLQRIDFEYNQALKFDHIVINDNLTHTIQQIEKIILN